MQPKNVIQAYQQAPWRKQLQIIGLFSLILVFAALIAGVYLNVTARAATVGRRILDMQVEIRENRQRNADLETQLALITSASFMEKRAEDLGYRPASSEEFLYVVVPGYVGRQPAVLAPPPGPVVASSHTLPAEFTQSLIDWIWEITLKPTKLLPGLVP